METGRQWQHSEPSSALPVGSLHLYSLHLYSLHLYSLYTPCISTPLLLAFLLPLYLSYSLITLYFPSLSAYSAALSLLCLLTYSHLILLSRMSEEKLNKYDRQLRLWASTGQANLESSSICLINATTTGAETLKNLILPGIGGYTIIDDRVVTPVDLEGNFFLNEDLLGKLKSQCMCELLNELNPDSKGQYLAKIPLNPDFWDAFSVVIASDNIAGSVLLDLKAQLFPRNIPLVIVRSVGYYGSVHIAISEVNVILTHTSKLYDLRIDKPWPELRQYVDSFDLEALDDTDHAHVPEVVIFIKALDEWRKSLTKQLPVKSDEKKQFQNIVLSMSRNINFETNFIEAIEDIRRVYRKTETPAYLKSLFNTTAKSDSFFWVLIKALKIFTEKYGEVPLAGSLPDMASDTKNYIYLKDIYKRKASEDKQRFIEVLKLQLLELSALQVDLTNEFIKNLNSLFVSQGSADESSDELIQLLFQGGTEEDDNSVNSIAIYYGLLTFYDFVDKHNSAPETHDLVEFTLLFNERFNKENKVLPASVINVFKEILNHNVSNYHNISSFLGGIVAQEVLKITTSQYIPLDNMLIFDGVRSVSHKHKITRANT